MSVEPLMVDMCVGYVLACYVYTRMTHVYYSCCIRETVPTECTLFHSIIHNDDLLKPFKHIHSHTFLHTDQTCPYFTFCYSTLNEKQNGLKSYCLTDMIQLLAIFTVIYRIKYIRVYDKTRDKEIYGKFSKRASIHKMGPYRVVALCVCVCAPNAHYSLETVETPYTNVTHFPHTHSHLHDTIEYIFYAQYKDISAHIQRIIHIHVLSRRKMIYTQEPYCLLYIALLLFKIIVK